MVTFVSYCRVSTLRQGKSGLGLEAQRSAVQNYVDEVGGEIIETFVEVESGSSKNRPQLTGALTYCKRHKAVLVIAKLDRLARNVAFVSTLMEAGVEFIAVDAPYANRFMLHILAAVAEHEREQISARTKAALAAAKTRGVQLGMNGAKLAAAHRQQAAAHAEAVRAAVRSAQLAGCTTLQSMANWLNGHSVPTATGGLWHATTVARVQKRLDL
jgi:DNA invertase Pin-like site-specific DNA recombinase